MADIQLSPSSINLFMDCKRCFWLKLNEKVKRPSGPFPSLPSGMDKMIKQHFDRYRGNGGAPPELDAADIDAVPFPDEEFLEQCRSWRTEPHFTDEDLNVVVKGGVDDLLVNDEGEIIVLDYKTRGYPPKEEVPGYYRRQVNLYNLILRQNGYATASFGLLLYYYPDTVLDNGDVVFENEFHQVPVDIPAARTLVQDAVNLLQGPLPEPEDGCEFCQWNAEDHDLF